MTKKDLENRSNQLNPLAPEFLSSRMNTLTQKDVAKIQNTEVRSYGRQMPSGPGAEAQKHFKQINNN